ncbi:hypothetical protein Pmar_PMAR027249, partial [Perkinsus marinus ATCC 50983]
PLVLEASRGWRNIWSRVTASQGGQYKACTQRHQLQGVRQGRSVGLGCSAEAR